MKTKQAQDSEPTYHILRDIVRYGSMTGALNAVEKGARAPARFESRCMAFLERCCEGDGASYDYVTRAGMYLGGPAVIYELRVEVHPLSKAKVR